MNEASTDITPNARLIAALADTMTNRMWATDIVMRCHQIVSAANEIKRIAEARVPGER